MKTSEFIYAAAALVAFIGTLILCVNKTTSTTKEKKIVKRTN